MDNFLGRSALEFSKQAQGRMISLEDSEWLGSYSHGVASFRVAL
jgi:hypothetical protein